MVMATKILIMGLPGSGKTYYAERLKAWLENNASLQHISTERKLTYKEKTDMIDLLLEKILHYPRPWKEQNLSINFIKERRDV